MCMCRYRIDLGVVYVHDHSMYSACSVPFYVTFSLSTLCLKLWSFIHYGQPYVWMQFWVTREFIQILCLFEFEHCLSDISRLYSSEVACWSVILDRKVQNHRPAHNLCEFAAYSAAAGVSNQYVLIAYTQESYRLLREIFREIWRRNVLSCIHRRKDKAFLIFVNCPWNFLKYFVI